MQNDESLGIVIVSIIGILLWAWITFEIIRSATRSTKIERHLRIQSQLLAKMAQKSGVPDEEINSIMNQGSTIRATKIKKLN